MQKFQGGCVAKPMKEDLDHIRKIKLKIKKIADDIRRKYLAIKTGQTETSETIQRFLKPITTPLEKIQKNTDSNSQIEQPLTLNTEAANPTFIRRHADELPLTEKINYLRKTDRVLQAEQTPSKQQSSQQKQFKKEEEVFTFENKNENDDDVEAFDKDDMETSIRDSDQRAYKEFIEQYPMVSRESVEEFFNKSETIDTSKLGVKYDGKQDKWYIGNKELKIDTQGNITVAQVTFNGTTGLYELLFQKEPKNYTQEDGQNYKRILDLSSAHKVNFNPDGNVSKLLSYKFITIIKPLFKLSRTQSVGFGIKIANHNPIEYVYWNDVNEIVDRLRLLLASQAAGNNGHVNEITSIIEELKEAGVIY